eukprot:325311_1
MNAFTVSNVEFNDIKVVAPTLRHWIHYLGPSTYRIAYMPTQMHPLDVKIGGVVIGRFFVEEGKVHRRLSDSVPRGAHADCQALVPGEDAALVEHCCSPDGASENEIRELAAKNVKLTKQLAQSADAEKRIADAVSERAAAVSERDAAVSGREAAESEADKLRKQIPDHPAALVDAQKAIVAVEKERDEAVEARQAAEAETEKLKTQIDDPPAALAKAEKARDTAEADRDAVVKDRDAAKSEIATLQKQVKDHSAAEANAETARKTAEADAEALRVQAKTLVQPAVLDEAVRARKSAEAETAKLREQVKTLPADAQNLIAIKTARDTAQSENVELNEKVGKLTAELAASEKTSKDAVSDLDISKAKTATLQKQVDDHEAQLQVFATQFSSERDKVTEMNNRILKLKRYKKRLKDAVEEVPVSRPPGDQLRADSFTLNMKTLFLKHLEPISTNVEECEHRICAFADKVVSYTTPNPGMHYIQEPGCDKSQHACMADLKNAA